LHYSLARACPAGKVENGIISGMDWFPTDGYNQMDLITGKGPSSRHEIYYVTESTLAAVRIDDFKYRFTNQPNGWFGVTVKVDWPILTNLRLDPYERTGMTGSIMYIDWFAFEFWRFVFVQQEIAKAAQSIIEYPPMQVGASFNLQQLKEELAKKMAAHASE
jgi:arylsulfatase